jgi:hypothetical protein
VQTIKPAISPPTPSLLVEGKSDPVGRTGYIVNRKSSKLTLNPVEKLRISSSSNETDTAQPTAKKKACHHMNTAGNNPTMVNLGGT